jgi:hypothetical protein
MGMVECKECVHYFVCKQYKNKPYFCNQYMDYKNTVEVVRCKDCKDHNRCVVEDLLVYFDPTVEHFCCHGERKDND